MGQGQGILATKEHREHIEKRGDLNRKILGRCGLGLKDARLAFGGGQLTARGANTVACTGGAVGLGCRGTTLFT